jgi:NAD(P)-dependent dehydrogenase (short-subunit alcohol dehydrogenase family)
VTSPGNECPIGGGDGTRQPAQPAELAASYVMLACDESSYLTGTLLAVSGGKSML